jgi:hAT family C-terminal dimerisation region
VAGCKDVVKFFHNHHVPKAQLQDLQQAVGVRALVRAAPTRWGTIQAMCLSLLESERHLHAIVTARDFLQGTATQKAERIKVREVVTGEDFVENLKKALAILEPLDKLIVKYQSDKVPISDVMHDFHALPDAFMKIFLAEIIIKQQFDYLVLLSQRRFRFMYGVAHGLSYMLDPRYLGQGLPENSRASLDEALINTPADDVTTTNDDRKEKLFMQYTSFFISATKEKQANSFRYQMLAKSRKTPFQYWCADGCQWPDLQKIAVELFSMATSSAASERNFSTMGFIHSKLRNSLSPKTVDRLVFIKSNLPAFYEYEAGDENDYQSDDHSVQSAAEANCAAIPE